MRRDDVITYLRCVLNGKSIIHSLTLEPNVYKARIQVRNGKKISNSVCEDHLEFSSFYYKYRVGATLQTAAAGGEQG